MHRRRERAKKQRKKGRNSLLVLVFGFVGKTACPVGRFKKGGARGTPFPGGGWGQSDMKKGGVATSNVRPTFDASQGKVPTE